MDGRARDTATQSALLERVRLTHPCVCVCFIFIFSIYFFRGACVEDLLSRDSGIFDGVAAARS